MADSAKTLFKERKNRIKAGFPVLFGGFIEALSFNLIIKRGKLWENLIIFFHL
jgi:hypothetical protein